MTDKKRCAWVTDDKLYQDYHDLEWGRPVHDDQKLFEAIVLDAFQAGLSWLTVLKKREAFRKAFENFNIQKVALYNTRQINILMKDPGIIRNILKLQAAVTNARLVIKLQEKHGSFDKYIWQFVGGKPIINHWKDISQIPTTSPESDAMSRDLKKLGFKFIGPTICYAFMQAMGMVVDHTTDCFLSTTD